MYLSSVDSVVADIKILALYFGRPFVSHFLKRICYFHSNASNELSGKTTTWYLSNTHI